MWLGLEDLALWPRTCSLESRIPSKRADSAGPDTWSPSNEGLTEKGFRSPPVPLPHKRLLLTLDPQARARATWETQVLLPAGRMASQRHFIPPWLCLPFCQRRPLNEWRQNLTWCWLWAVWAATP